MLYDVMAENLTAAVREQRTHLEFFVKQEWISRIEVEATAGRINTTTDPRTAAERADLISESVPENLSLKRELFAQFHQLCDPHTLFTTNTSYLLPSKIAEATGRPDKFAALHFHPDVWASNVVDIMPHPGTSDKTLQLLTEFSERIGQIPIVCRNEHDGYVFNTMLRSLLMAALTQVESGAVSYENIDRAWMGVMRTNIGPFGIMDNIGLDTIRDVMTFWSLFLHDPQLKRNAAYLKTWVDAGQLGVKSGRGFYPYPQPAYLREDFFSGRSEPMPGRQRPTLDSRATGTTLDRFVLRAVPAPLNQNLKHELKLHGPALILGENPTADALRRQLESLGGKVISLPWQEGLEAALNQFDRVWEQQPIPHLFLLTARDQDAVTTCEVARWTRRFEHGVLLPYFVCQRWFTRIAEAGIFDRATLVAATALGGNFGISSAIEAAEGGGLTGLLKTVFMEGAVRSALGPQVKVVDAALNEPPLQIAEWICKETALAQASVVTGIRDESRRRYADLEVGYVQGKRHVTRVECAPVRDALDPNIPRGGVWVVTGGMRGITAVVAQELGRKYQLKLHFLGRTRLPDSDYSHLSDDQIDELKRTVMKNAYVSGEKPVAAWDVVAKGIETQKSLRLFSEAGIEPAYHTCDVGDYAALSSVLVHVREQDGPIQGVIHGAGVEVTARFQQKSPESVTATVAPKFKGMLGLMELTRNDPLRYFIVFGSLSGRFGNFGQTDYAMANDMLCKLLKWFRAQRPECQAVAFHWPGWEQVGMAARPEARAGLQRGRHTFLSPEEGVRHLLNELGLGTPAGEVIIIDRHELPDELLMDSIPTHSKPQ